MAEILITIIFITGYTAIALENKIHINKAASALLAGVLTWTVFICFSAVKDPVSGLLVENLGGVAGILFFLLGAMTIVELINAHDGFEVITDRISTRKKSTLLWTISLITFFLSALLDNMTTTIIMISLVRRILPDQRDRMLFAGVIVIASNSGGSWSPMGDVTTTMLWIGNQITPWRIVSKLFFPSLISTVVPVLLIIPYFKNHPVSSPLTSGSNRIKKSRFERNLVFWAGILSLLSVPVFKTLTHLPPLMGMLLALGLMWILTEIIHKRKNETDKSKLSVVSALRNADSTTILFFLGILLCISALRSVGLLAEWSTFLSTHIESQSIIILLIGLLSSVIDNVPLVAAVQGMYPLSVYPTDHYFWEFLAYAAGTGGSILVIGSAAGVVSMGMEKINFIWYLKKISWMALLGYFAGALVYMLQALFLNL
jgi:Na+/H+ antiporter NhaD/arsenite permease-like protein